MNCASLSTENDPIFSETLFSEEGVKITGKEWDEDAGLYYYNARWYDANSGRFTSEDPIRDGLNYYVYVNNNPVNFVDPTGLWSSSKGANSNPYASDGDATEEEDLYYEREEEKVKDHFSYMEGYDLTRSEIYNYSSLVDKQGQIDRAIGSERDLLETEYGEMMLGMLHTQTNLGMIPAGGPEPQGGACLYRSIQGGIEFITGRPMSISMINQATIDLAGRVDGLSQIANNNGSLSGDYFVENTAVIANNALNKLGLGGALGAERVNPGPNWNYGGHTANNPYNAYTVRGKGSHFNLGDHNGQFLWDPMGGHDRVANPTGYRSISVEWQ